jgi:hypothetical protein
MKKILIVCDEGLNRSVTIRGQLQYLGYDCLTVGLKRNSLGTIKMLFDWSDLVILTSKDQGKRLVKLLDTIWLDNDGPISLTAAGWNTQLWDIGPDIYPRPYNKKLLALVRRLIQTNKNEGTLP